MTVQDSCIYSFHFSHPFKCLHLRRRVSCFHRLKKTPHLLNPVFYRQIIKLLIMLSSSSQSWQSAPSPLERPQNDLSSLLLIFLNYYYFEFILLILQQKGRASYPFERDLP